MRRWIGLAVIAAQAGACGADTVQVRFVTDRDDIAEVRMAVYAEGDDPISCAALEFSEIDDDVLAQALVVEVSGAPGDRVELGEIPRDENKLFFAEALNDAGVSVLAGCAPGGLVDGDVTIDIEPRDRTVILPFAAAEVAGDQVSVTGLVVTDLTGTPLRDAEIHWTLTGPDRFEVDGTTTTGSEPGTSVTIANGPTSPGPIRFEARASWSKPSQISTFKIPRSIGLELPTGAVSTGGQGLTDTLEVGRLGVGAVGLVALVDAGGERVGQLHCFDQPGTLSRQSSEVPLPEVVALGILRDPAGGRVIGVGGADWNEISCAAAPVVKPTPFSGRPTKLVSMPGCTDDDNDGAIDADPALYAQVSATELGAANPAGGVLTDFSKALPPEEIEPGIVLRTSGCVDDVLGATNPTVVLTQTRDSGDPTFRTLVAARVAGTPQVGQVGGLTTAVGASLRPGSGGLQLGQITAEGPNIGRYDLQPLANNTLTASLVGEDSTASQVIEIASGDVDGDGLTDIVALLAFANSVQVFVSLALPDTDDRLRGFFAGPITDRAAELRVADVDQDGDDDIILFGTEGDNLSLTVLEMGD